jgi:hypothetical protein
MQRPIGVTLLAIGAALVGLYEIWRALVFMGVVSFNFVGKAVSFPDPQWGQVLWALILAAIWFWIAAGFWNVRAYAWSFGNFIALFTLIWGFFAVLFGSSVEAETIPWLLAGAIFLYLNYPGVRDHFYEKEMSLLTPEQRAAMEKMQAAQAEFAQAGTGAAAAAAPAASAVAPPPPPAPAAPAAPAAPPAAPPPSTPPDDTTPAG